MRNNQHEIIIEPARFTLNLTELWKYRELFFFFTWRDIKVKYKQTFLGVLWVVLQPLITVLIFTLFFGVALKVPSQNIDYPVFVFSGLLLWNVFSMGLINGGNSMVNNAQIIKKIYFPRLIIPISSILVAVFDFFIAFVIYLALLIFYQTKVQLLLALVCWPFAIVVTIVGTLGMSSMLGALNVKYRDFRYIVPFMVQILLFLSPVIYPVSIIDVSWVNTLLALNPMYGAIVIFRIPIVDFPQDWTLISMSLVSSLFLFVTGIFYFKKSEAFFADIA